MYVFADDAKIDPHILCLEGCML